MMPLIRTFLLIVFAWLSIHSPQSSSQSVVVYSKRYHPSPFFTTAISGTQHTLSRSAPGETEFSYYLIHDMLKEIEDLRANSC